MKIKSIVAGAAIVLVATIGSVSAADQFTTIAGFEAQAMTKQEMEETRGSFLYWNIGFYFLDKGWLGETSTNSTDQQINVYVFDSTLGRSN
jgi:hypothetical protein